VNVLGVGVSNVAVDQAVAAIERFVASRRPHYVCVSNVHTVMMSQYDQGYRRIQNRAAMVTPDGMPLAWFARLQGYEQRCRVRGVDLMLASLQASARTGTAHYLYGGRDGVVRRLAEMLRARVPGVRIVGTHSPPFRPLAPGEDDEDVRRINASGADIVWVGLGAPKQERWMADHLGRVDAPVLVGVGAAFDFLAGAVPQAPAWMQDHGLEWLFRLRTEPRRVWRRYVFNNPMFLLLATLQLLGLRRYDLP
jgi:N-acetylglucosaminyldiphosphoundecaprenol N-acetyl-beta-D-mannosaminyltransferase